MKCLMEHLPCQAFISVVRILTGQTVPADAALNGGNVVKDSASSTISGEIGMQPYIRRNPTDDSGYSPDPHTISYLHADSTAAKFWRPLP